MFLLTIPSVKAVILSFQKNALDRARKPCNTKFGPLRKNRKVVIMSDQFQHFFAT